MGEGELNVEILQHQFKRNVCPLDTENNILVLYLGHS